MQVRTYLRIAVRNLNRQKKRSFLLGGAIAFGIMIVTVVNSLTAGFVANMRDNFAELLAGHIYITGAEKSASGRTIYVIRDDAPLIKSIEESGIAVRQLARRSMSSGQLVFEGNSAVQNVNGVDWSREAYLTERLRAKAGSLEGFLADPRGLSLSEPVAAKLKATVGDSIIMKLETVSGQMNVGEFTLRLVVSDPGILGSVSAYAHMAYVNELLDVGAGAYNQLSIFLENAGRIGSSADLVYKKMQENGVPLFGRYKVVSNTYTGGMDEASTTTWTGTKYQLTTITEILASLENMAQTLNGIALGILLVLLLIIMVGIVNTFRMIMYERIREIGTMRALGAQRGAIRSIFLLEALLLSIFSAVLGIALGMAIMAAVSLIDLSSLSTLSFLLKNGRIGFTIQPMSVIGNALLVALLTLLAALLPAARAARLRPARALSLRY